MLWFLIVLAVALLGLAAVLACTAGFISDTLDMTTDQAERVIDDQARQFEELKPYLVGRWNEMRSATGRDAAVARADGTGGEA